ncbi:GNAT family N-acetyltransferase [Rubrivirga sp. IMCC43871]|uniref:GNAT family N-acetyltransferase n=1 Tax=Rubrivirga sp. IMCC43871 TaxID=3391575 RepID=UPI00398FD688
MPDVRHDPDSHTFTADVEGGAAELAYEMRGQAVAFVHTFVPEPARGENVGTALVEAGLSWARDNGRPVIAQCPFVAAYMDDHPGEQDLLAA